MNPRPRPRNRNSKKAPKKPKPAGRRRLLPVLRPIQNMRDIIKQLVLLEDHLLQPQKRCKDCIRKHFLTVEGLAEECVTLCKPQAILPEARKVASKARIFHHAWEQGPNDPAVAEGVGSRLRKLRKGLLVRFSKLPLNKLPSKETEAVQKLLKSIRGQRNSR